MGNSFDEKAATWDENPRRIKLVEKVWNVLQNEIDFDQVRTVLDYGCGTGLLGYKMVNEVDHIYFCDTSIPMLEQVKLKKEFYKHDNVQILNADFTVEIPEIKPVDLIVSMLVLHHVKDIDKLIKSFTPVLNANGMFCWVDLDKEDGSFHDDNTGIHHFGFSKDELRNYLEKNGFEIEFYNKQLFVAKDRDGDIQKYPLFVLMAKKTTNS